MGREDPATYAGWVFKEGSLVRSWKKRFLVCKGAELAYYKNTDEENHAQLLGALTAAHIERLPDITNGLLIHGTEGRQLKIFTDTKQECNRCFEAISKYCKMQNTGDGALQRVGWLEKEGQHFRTWKRRYFVLSGTQLTYSAAMGAEKLGGGRVIGAKRDASRPFTLAVTFEGGRNMRVGGKSEGDIDDWHKALRHGLLYAQKQRESEQGSPSIDDDPRNARDKELARRQASASVASNDLTDDEASSLFGAPPLDVIDTAKGVQNDQRKVEKETSEEGESKENYNSPLLYSASSFRRHIVVETMPDNTASFIEVAERESESSNEKPFSPTAPGTSTIRRMRLAEKLLQEELEEERREAMLKENTVLMRTESRSDGQDPKSACCCIVM
ncbi:putative pleckstrin domain, PH-like domain superfamily [Plasmopara halstedii]